MGRRARRNTALGPIGVDVDDGAVKLAQLVRGDDAAHELEVAIGIAPAGGRLDWRSDPDAAVSLLRQTLRSGAFVGRPMVGCVPDDVLEYRTMRFGKLRPRELQAAVHERFGAELDLPAEAYRTQLFDAGAVWEGDEERVEVIAMAAPMADLDAYLSIMVRCDLTPCGIDARPNALVRALHPLVDEAPVPELALLMEVGERSTMLSVARGDRIRFVRRLGDGRGERDGGGATPASSARNLASHVTKGLQYCAVTFREPRPSRGVVVGAGADDELIDALRSATGIDLQPARIGSGAEWIQVARDRDGAGDPGVWAVAAGLCLYDLKESRERAAA